MKEMRFIILALFVGMAAMVATAAAQPSPYLVTVDSAPSGSYLFYASDDVGATFAVKHPIGTTTSMSCVDVNLEGEVHAGTGDPFMEIKPVTRLNTPESFDGSERKGCVGPFALMMSIVQTNQWEVHALGTPTVWDIDVLPVYLSGPDDTPLRAHVYATSGGPTGQDCNFIVEGYADGTFDETQTLAINESDFSGALTITSADGDCLGLTPVGSTVNVSSSFTIGRDSALNTMGNITDLHPVLFEP